jgi:hypothetical protein
MCPGRCKFSRYMIYNLLKLHSKRVEKMSNYTRNEWRRSTPWTLSVFCCPLSIGTVISKTLLLSFNSPCLSLKIHSKRVEKIEKYTRNGWKRCKNTLETSVKYHLTICSTFSINPLSDTVNDLLVTFTRLIGQVCPTCSIFSTRSECSFTSFPLSSSVLTHLLHSFRV